MTDLKAEKYIKESRFPDDLGVFYIFEEKNSRTELPDGRYIFINGFTRIYDENGKNDSTIFNYPDSRFNFARKKARFESVYYCGNVTGVIFFKEFEVSGGVIVSFDLYDLPEFIPKDPICFTNGDINLRGTKVYVGKFLGVDVFVTE